MASFQSLILLSLCFSAALACWIPPVGKKACSPSVCNGNQITGYYQVQDTAGWVQGTGGGINYEFYSTLQPSKTVTVNNVEKPMVQLLSKTYAANFSVCCNACAKLHGCQLWRHFPVSSTDAPSYTLASACKPYGDLVTFPLPYPPCAFSGTQASYCNYPDGTAYNPNDGTNNCILFSLNGNLKTITSQGATSCTVQGPNCVANLDSTSTGPVLPSGSGVSASGTNPCRWTSGGHAWTRSYYGGTCNPVTSGLVKDDPHFRGGDNVPFEFNGEVDKSFCLITDSNIHINMLLGGYLDERTTGATIMKNGMAVRSWITGLNFMWKDAAGEKHSFSVSARKADFAERGRSLLSGIKLDDKPSIVPEKVGDAIVADGISFTLTSQTVWGSGDMDVFILRVGDFKAEISVRAAHPLLRTPEDAFVHFNLKVDEFNPTTNVHGVLGQTFRTDAKHLLKTLEYSLLASLMRGPFQADGENGVGYLDGKMEDYMTSSLTAADCKFATAWLQ